MTEQAADDGRWLLAIDTATTRVVIAAGQPDGTPIAESAWEAGFRHGETLLPALARLIEANDLARDRLAGIIVGTGPGAFTGLRVGLATAKGLARSLGIPIAGVPTAQALLTAARTREAADRDLALLLPAGPSDRVLVAHGRPERLPAGKEPVLGDGAILVAVDLDGRAPADALELGERAREGLGSTLLALGAARLSDSSGDDLATLVPEYVTLPRGVHASSGEVTWSRGRR
jgi:tRNA threonylcarbamoyladenosine biosynthesis protein TsaB